MPMANDNVTIRLDTVLTIIMVITMTITNIVTTTTTAMTKANDDVTIRLDPVSTIAVQPPSQPTVSSPTFEKNYAGWPPM